jgi:hypothetical protein
MKIRIALIPLITYTLPNDLATHNNVYNYRIFDKKHIYFFMAKYITTVLILTSILDKLTYDLTRSSCNSIYMYVGGLLNNLEQYANIDHNNNVDNHVNLATV